MTNILIVSGHPDLTKSVANTTIMQELATQLPEAHIRKLDQLHSHYQFDIAAEQEALVNADLVVWQFPFYWYTMPALMKKWLDDVFHHGFAHGSTAKLGGKKLLISITTGAPEAIYQKDGFFKHTMQDYLTQFETTAMLCGMELIGVEYLNGVSYVGRDEVAIAQQQADSKAYAQKVIAKINSL